METKKIIIMNEEYEVEEYTEEEEIIKEKKDKVRVKKDGNR